MKVAELLDELYEQCLVKDLAAFDRAAQRYVAVLVLVDGGMSMENPATWKPAEVIIMNAYEEWHEMTSHGLVGSSIGKFIADALRKEKLLDDAATPELGWVKLREMRDSHDGR